MRYDYLCNDCSDDEGLFVFEISHGMKESPTVECPQCGGKKTERCMGSPTFYVRGDGYLDKAGCHRDMELHNLIKKNPYGHMYQPGEKDDIAQRLRTGGKVKKKSVKETLRKCVKCGEMFWTNDGSHACERCSK